MGADAVSGLVGKLVVVGTPIGNLSDFSARGRAALEAADVVCAEDTRVTGKLLAALSIQKPLERLDENVIAERADAIAQRIAAGETIAFCSDAGMPAISDPGARLIATVRAAGLPVEVVPGPSAADMAFVASGSLERDFYFGGFLPRKTGELTRRLETLRDLESALIFFESPQRLVDALETIDGVFPDRRLWVCRELTKLHEEILEGTAASLAGRLRERERAEGRLRGEITLVIDGPSPAEREAAAEREHERGVKLARSLIDAGVSARTASELVSEQTNLGRNEAKALVRALIDRD